MFLNLSANIDPSAYCEMNRNLVTPRESLMNRAKPEIFLLLKKKIKKLYSWKSLCGTPLIHWGYEMTEGWAVRLAQMPSLASSRELGKSQVSKWIRELGKSPQLTREAGQWQEGLCSRFPCAACLPGRRASLHGSGRRLNLAGSCWAVQRSLGNKCNKSQNK